MRNVVYELCICKACNCFTSAAGMQQENQEMADYQHINPYEMMYRNMNFQINEHITRETAEKVARQLGFMHNAFGIIAKDLIKILSFRFEPAHPTTRKPERTIYHVEDPTPKYRERPPPEAMELEDSNVEQHRPHGTKKKVVEAQQVRVQPISEAVKEAGVGIGQKQDVIQDKPPNLDFLGQFAYEKSGHEESKNTKDNLTNTFKERLSKIVEEVANKRKKTSKNAPEPIQDPSKDTKLKGKQKGKKLTFSSPQSQSKPLTHSHEQQSKPILGALGQNAQLQPQEVQAPGLFEQFEYKKQESNKSPSMNVPQPPGEQQPVQQGNRLWQLLQQNRDSPQVYEISDDE